MKLARYTNPTTNSSDLAFACHGKLYRVADVERALTGESLNTSDLEVRWGAIVQHVFNNVQRYEQYYKELSANAAALSMVKALDADSVSYEPPISYRNKLLCVGKNYATHLEELKRTNLIKELPSEPTGFVKINDSLVGHGAKITKPESVSQLDYEPELVFVLGKGGMNITEEAALSHVLGITLLNDLTCRETQLKEVQSGTRFWTAKNAPGFGPLGPCIVSMAEIKDPYNLWVSCSVNGEERMRVNTSEQIWKITKILAHFSRLVPLSPGDMFSTGAPGGVAVGQPNSEALFLKSGDTVTCSIDELKLDLVNHIR